MSSETAPDALHDLFWNSREHASPDEAVKCRRRLEAGIETVVRMRGLAPVEAAKEAFQGLVVAYSNETFPRNSSPNICAHCHRRETPEALLLPLGVGPHAWLHRSCADPWRESRRKDAIAELAAMKIEAP